MWCWYHAQPAKWEGEDGEVMMIEEVGGSLHKGVGPHIFVCLCVCLCVCVSVGAHHAAANIGNGTVYGSVWQAPGRSPSETCAHAHSRVRALHACAPTASHPVHNSLVCVCVCVRVLGREVQDWGRQRAVSTLAAQVRHLQSLAPAPSRMFACDY